MLYGAALDYFFRGSFYLSANLTVFDEESKLSGGNPGTGIALKPSGKNSENPEFLLSIFNQRLQHRNHIPKTPKMYTSIEMRRFLLPCLSTILLMSLRCHGFLPSSTAPLREARSLPQSPIVLKQSSVVQTIGPTVEFTDPETGCEVVLVGCFHGTASSAEDVSQAVTPETDIVILELCAARFKDLKRAAEEDLKLQSTGFGGYMKLVSKAIETKGFATGLATAVLVGFSDFQSSLSGFDPGVEFKTALDKSILHDCDIVLADQVVDETLRRIGSLPQVSWEMNNLSKNTTRVLENWSMNSKSLKQAIVGDESLPRVELGKFLFRNSAAMKDLLRFATPTFSLMFLLLTVGSSHALTDESMILSDPSIAEQTVHYFASAALFLSTYLGFFLPAVKVILFERDQVLANGIKASCKRAGKDGRVVAVLGFLHVNGVTKKMLQETI